MNRLNKLPTLRISSEEKIPFTYKGKTLYGVAGDTIATALYANGIRIFSRSLKYHRPRGLYSLDGECSNTCMEVNGIPNVRTENTLLKKGMVIKEQNVKGSAENDFMGFMDYLSPMMPAGFYYKTLHKPARIWPIAMKQIRKAAGLGTIKPDFEMKGRYDEIYPKADVCVIGGGLAGMTAAISAAASGVRVILLEARPWLGGSHAHRTALDDKGVPFFQSVQDLAGKVEETSNIRVFKHTSMISAYANNLITAFQVGNSTDAFDERYIEIRAESVVVATGCIERPLIFENNERPGIMQVGCAQRLAHVYGLMPGQNAVFSIGHDIGLEAAVDLFDLGVKINCIADIRNEGQDPALIQAIAERKITYRPGWVALKSHGKKCVRKVTLGPIKTSAHEDYDCDLLVASAGMTPVTGPLTLAQATTSYDPHTGFFLPRTLPENTYAAGRLVGLDNASSIEVSGRLAGLEAAGDCGRRDGKAIIAALNELNNLPGPTKGTEFVTSPGDGHKSFICFDEDTTIKNINQAMNMGFDVPELIKRFTSAGTGPGQGGIPGHNLPLYVGQHSSLTEQNYRPTTVRPPLVPTFIATYAGSNHDMSKRTPVDASQKIDGGIFRRIGVWNRARYFSKDFSCREEIKNVRTNVGMLDASTLGKFRIHGPDALNALQRIYISDMSRMKQGKIKYSAMCNEDGCVIDDGVIVKRGEDDYYFTTSTGRAGATIEWFRYHTRFDGWNLHMVNLTDAMGVINISGPNARKILEKVADTDVSNEAFPFIGYREFTIKDVIPVRAMRLGFVGELSFELHVPSSYMQSLWDILKEAGKTFNVQNFGVEAQNVLRMEKGHIILGQESEQRTNLLDVGLGFLWDRNKTTSKTVGAAALRHTEKDTNRLTLVGIKMENTKTAPRDGSIIVDRKIRGYVCTARYSFNLDEAVGMALVESELSKINTRLEIFEDECGGQRLSARVVPMPFYDPEGKRMRM